MNRSPSQSKPKTAPKPKKSVATLLVDYAHAAGVELFHTPLGVPFANVATDSHHETWPVRSAGFRLWLRRLYFRTTRAAVGTQAVEDALATLEGQALFDGEQDDVHLRLAEWEGALYLDLADPLWQAVEITPAGWTIRARSPVRFRRPNGMEALPMPLRGGTLESLRELVTLDDDSWRLVAGWFLGTLRPNHPFPVLVLHGEQGTAKSTLAKMLRRLVDPNTADLRPCPREEYDCILAARHGWIIAFDNVSVIKPWLSDVFCRIATGIGYGRRKLWTDEEEHLLSVKRPIVLNGIEDVAVKGDLLDRAIVTTLPRIEEHARREEDELWRAFDAAQPFLLGAVLDVVSSALARLPDVQLHRRPRIADFARWVTAAEPALDWTAGAFLASYFRNRSRSVTTALEGSLIVGPLRALLEARGRYEGTVGGLLEALNAGQAERTLRAEEWPKDPIRLSGELRRLAPALRRVGIYMRFPKRTREGRRITVWSSRAERARRSEETQERIAKRTSPTSPTSPTLRGSEEAGQGDVGDDDSPTLSFMRTNGTGAGETGSPAVRSNPAQRCLRCNGTLYWHDNIAGDRCATCEPPPASRA